MNRFLLGLICLCSGVSALSAEPTSEDGNIADSITRPLVELVAERDHWHESIEKDSTLKREVIQGATELRYEPQLVRFSTESGELRALKVEIRRDHGLTLETYFFHRGELFYIDAQDEYRQFKGTGKEANPETKYVMSRQRYYFDAGKCIRAFDRQVENEDRKLLAGLMTSAKEESLNVGLGEDEYVRKAIEVSKIMSAKDLEAFVLKILKG